MRVRRGSANDGAATHGDCAAGAVGADTLVLAASSTYTLTAIDNYQWGPNGLRTPTVLRSLMENFADGVRITSYNVCYTKLLRRTLDDLSGEQGLLLFLNRSADW